MLKGWSPLRVFYAVAGSVVAAGAVIIPALFPPALVLQPKLLSAGTFLIGVAWKTPGHVPDPKKI